MSDPVVYVDRSSVHDGALDDLEPAMAELVEFVEATVPELRSYGVYFDGDGTGMTVVHVHDSQETLAELMEAGGPKFEPIGEFITLESIDVYGRVDEALVDRLREKASTLGEGTVRIHEFHGGFDRVPVD